MLHTPGCNSATVVAIDESQAVKYNCRRLKMEASVDDFHIETRVWKLKCDFLNGIQNAFKVVQQGNVIFQPDSYDLILQCIKHM